MSRTPGAVIPAVEWSPSFVRAYLPGRGLTDSIPNSLGSIRAALSRGNTFVRAIRIPNVSAADTEKILKLQLPQTFPVPAAELVFTYRLTNDTNAEGRLVLVAAARAEVVRQLHAALRELGVNPQEIVASAFGSMLLAKTMRLPNVAVVEHTPEGWAIDIIVDSELRYSRVIPLATGADALESEVCRTFGMAGLPCGQILAAGGTHLSFADVSTDKSTLELLTHPDAYALRVGLELPEVLISREKKQIGARARLAVLMSFGAVALGMLVFVDRMDKAAEIRKEQTAWNIETRKLESARTSAKAKVAGLSKTTETLDRAFTPLQKPSEILALLSALAPREIWLTGISFERGKPISIRGTALSTNAVAAYVDSLSGNERFRDVKLVYANDADIEETKVAQFSISLHAIGNLPLVDSKTKARTVSR